MDRRIGTALALFERGAKGTCLLYEEAGHVIYVSLAELYEFCKNFPEEVPLLNAKEFRLTLDLRDGRTRNLTF